MAHGVGPFVGVHLIDLPGDLCGSGPEHGVRHCDRQQSSALELGEQRCPGRIQISGLCVQATQARSDTGNHERADPHPFLVDDHRKVRHLGVGQDFEPGPAGFSGGDDDLEIGIAAWWAEAMHQQVGEGCRGAIVAYGHGGRAWAPPGNDDGSKSSEPGHRLAEVVGELRDIAGDSLGYLIDRLGSVEKAQDPHQAGPIAQADSGGRADLQGDGVAAQQERSGPQRWSVR